MTNASCVVQYRQMLPWLVSRQDTLLDCGLRRRQLRHALGSTQPACLQHLGLVPAHEGPQRVLLHLQRGGGKGSACHPHPGMWRGLPPPPGCPPPAVPESPWVQPAPAPSAHPVKLVGVDPQHVHIAWEPLGAAPLHPPGKGGGPWCSGGCCYAGLPQRGSAHSVAGFDVGLTFVAAQSGRSQAGGCCSRNLPHTPPGHRGLDLVNHPGPLQQHLVVLLLHDLLGRQGPQCGEARTASWRQPCQSRAWAPSAATPHLVQ